MYVSSSSSASQSKLPPRKPFTVLFLDSNIVFETQSRKCNFGRGFVFLYLGFVFAFVMERVSNKHEGLGGRCEARSALQLSSNTTSQSREVSFDVIAEERKV